MSEIFQFIYIQPKWLVSVVGICVVLVWGIVARLMRRDEALYKTFRIIAAALFLLIIFGILYRTILSRAGDDARKILLVPFAGYDYFNIGEEYYRMLIMNALLFVPLGMSLPFLIEGRRGLGKHPVFGTIILGFIFSLAIEIFQYIFSFGTSEADDLIMNTIGTAIGSLGYVICWAGKRNRG